MKSATFLPVISLALGLCAPCAWSQPVTDEPVGHDHGLPVFQLPDITVIASPDSTRIAHEQINRNRQTDQALASGDSTGMQHSNSRYSRMHVAGR